MSTPRCPSCKSTSFTTSEDIIHSVIFIHCEQCGCVVGTVESRQGKIYRKLDDIERQLESIEHRVHRL